MPSSSKKTPDATTNFLHEDAQSREPASVFDNGATRWWSDMLLTWYEEHKRELPWRETCDPYAIWISEIILQQTRVVQGLEYFQRFMQRFPNVQALAEANEDEVLKLWQGLGYYSRARNLHTAAKQIVENGKFPSTYEDIKKLKGVGDYTAAAIASIAFGLPHAVVDGNVYRVLARYFGFFHPIDTTQGQKWFKECAELLLDKKNPGRYNQAIMDFGATQCTPWMPDCTQCPCSEGCWAKANNKMAELPIKQKKMVVQHRYFSYLYVRTGEHILLRRRPKGDIWQGLYEPVVIEGKERTLSEEELREHPQLQSMLSAAPLRLLAQNISHLLTHRHLHADFYVVEAPAGTAIKGYDVIPEDLRSQYAVPRLVERLFEMLDA